MTLDSCDIYENTATNVSDKSKHFPNTPLGDLLKATLLLIVQGGGLALSGGTATLNSCTLFNNDAANVRDKSSALSRLLVMKHYLFFLGG